MIKGIIIALGIFTTMLTFRIIWGYVKYPDGQTTQYRPGTYLSNFNLNRKNIANYRKQSSKSFKGGKFSGKGFTGGKSSVTPQDISSGKYEKVGSLVTQTKKFEKNEKEIYSIIKTKKAVVQFEQKTGLKEKSNRLLKLGIGVNPNEFEDMIQKLHKIGKVVSAKIVKTEKTNEYKELQAKRKSLEKSRAALAKYRGVGNKVNELISLENRILEIENQIQSFGVELGDFDNEHEFVTIKLVLVELKKIETTYKIPTSQRLKAALEWTILYYYLLIKIAVLVVFSIFGLLAIIFAITLLIEKFKIVRFNPIQINLGKAPTDSTESTDGKKKDKQ